MTSIAKAVVLVSIIVLTLLTPPIPASPPPIPNPVLVFTGAEYLMTGGKTFTRYKYEVFNRAAYPRELFAAAPDLPPCGANTNSARTWVDVFDQRGKRLNGFCALGGPDALVGIWFAVESDVIPPSWIYIEMNDRKTNTKYKSGLAETTL
jgi:hypothetical protein